MSLTSYRTAPPRVTFNRLRMAVREQLDKPSRFREMAAECSTPLYRSENLHVAKSNRLKTPKGPFREEQPSDM